MLVALIFDFTNGAHDCANAIATVVSTKVLSPRTAVLMAAILNMLGVITLALFLFHKIDVISVPFWVKLACALAMGPRARHWAAGKSSRQWGTKSSSWSRCTASRPKHRPLR